MANLFSNHYVNITKQENLSSSETPLFEILPKEILIEILSYCDIPNIINVGKTSRYFYEIANDSRLWKHIACNVGITNFDEVIDGNAKQQLKDIDSLALSHFLKESSYGQQDDVPREKKHIPNRDSVTINTLKENLLKITCNDFLRVWGNIIYYTSSSLMLPDKAQILQDPKELDKMMSKWIDDNKESLNSLKYLCLNHLNLKFLPTSITKLSNLERIDLRFNCLSSLPESFGDLSQLLYIDLRNNKLSFLPGSLVYLINLQGLYLKGNELTSLPKLDNFSKSCNIYFNEDPKKDIRFL